LSFGRSMRGVLKGVDLNSLSHPCADAAGDRTRSPGASGGSEGPAAAAPSPTREITHAGLFVDPGPRPPRNPILHPKSEYLKLPPTIANCPTDAKYSAVMKNELPCKTAHCPTDAKCPTRAASAKCHETGYNLLQTKNMTLNFDSEIQSILRSS